MPQSAFWKSRLTGSLPVSNRAVCGMALRRCTAEKSSARTGQSQTSFIYRNPKKLKWGLTSRCVPSER